MATHRQTLLAISAPASSENWALLKRMLNAVGLDVVIDVVTKSGPAEAESSLKTKVNRIREVVVRTKQKFQTYLSRTLGIG